MKLKKALAAILAAAVVVTSGNYTGLLGTSVVYAAPAEALTVSITGNTNVVAGSSTNLTANIKLNDNDITLGQTYYQWKVDGEIVSDQSTYIFDKFDSDTNPGITKDVYLTVYQSYTVNGKSYIKTLNESKTITSKARKMTYADVKETESELPNFYNDTDAGVALSAIADPNGNTTNALATALGSWKLADTSVLATEVAPTEEEPYTTTVKAFYVATSTDLSKYDFTSDDIAELPTAVPEDGKVSIDLTKIESKKWYKATTATTEGNVISAGSYVMFDDFDITVKKEAKRVTAISSVTATASDLYVGEADTASVVTATATGSATLEEIVSKLDVDVSYADDDDEDALAAELVVDDSGTVGDATDDTIRVKVTPSSKLAGVATITISSKSESDISRSITVASTAVHQKSTMDDAAIDEDFADKTFTYDGSTSYADVIGDYAQDAENGWTYATALYKANAAGDEKEGSALTGATVIAAGTYFVEVTATPTEATAGVVGNQTKSYKVVVEKKVLSSDTLTASLNKALKNEDGTSKTFDYKTAQTMNNVFVSYDDKTCTIDGVKYNITSDGSTAVEPSNTELREKTFTLVYDSCAAATDDATKDNYSLDDALSSGFSYEYTYTVGQVKGGVSIDEEDTIQLNTTSLKALTAESSVAYGTQTYEWMKYENNEFVAVVDGTDGTVSTTTATGDTFTPTTAGKYKCVLKVVTNGTEGIIDESSKAILKDASYYKTVDSAATIIDGETKTGAEYATYESNVIEVLDNQITMTKTDATVSATYGSAAAITTDKEIKFEVADGYTLDKVTVNVFNSNNEKVYTRDDTIDAGVTSKSYTGTGLNLPTTLDAGDYTINFVVTYTKDGQSYSYDSSLTGENISFSVAVNTLTNNMQDVLAIPSQVNYADIDVDEDGNVLVDDEAMTVLEKAELDETFDNLYQLYADNLDFAVISDGNVNTATTQLYIVATLKEDAPDTDNYNFDSIVGEANAKTFTIAVDQAKFTVSAAGDDEDDYIPYDVNDAETPDWSDYVTFEGIKDADSEIFDNKNWGVCIYDKDDVTYNEEEYWEVKADATELDINSIGKGEYAVMPWVAGFEETCYNSNYSNYYLYCVPGTLKVTNTELDAAVAAKEQAEAEAEATSKAKEEADKKAAEAAAAQTKAETEAKAATDAKAEADKKATEAAAAQKAAEDSAATANAAVAATTAVGTALTTNNTIYKVTASDTVSITAAGSSSSKVTIDDSVTINGKTFTVASVAKNAFKNSKATVSFKTAKVSIAKNAFKNFKGKVVISKSLSKKEQKALKKALKKAGVKSSQISVKKVK